MFLTAQLAHIHKTYIVTVLLNFCVNPQFFVYFDRSKNRNFLTCTEKVVTEIIWVVELWMLIVVGAYDQSITDRQGILMQILLVAGLKIVLFTSKHTVTNIMSVHGSIGLTDTCP